jgi:hypothetical protein
LVTGPEQVHTVNGNGETLWTVLNSFGAVFLCALLRDVMDAQQEKLPLHSVEINPSGGVVDGILIARKPWRGRLALGARCPPKELSEFLASEQDVLVIADDLPRGERA